MRSRTSLARPMPATRLLRPHQVEDPSAPRAFTGERAAQPGVPVSALWLRWGSAGRPAARTTRAGPCHQPVCASPPPRPRCHQALPPATPPASRLSVAQWQSSSCSAVMCSTLPCPRAFLHGTFSVTSACSSVLRPHQPAHSPGGPGRLPEARPLTPLACALPGPRARLVAWHRSSWAPRGGPAPALPAGCRPAQGGARCSR